MAVIATLSGTALRPGISKNRRYYSPEMIARMVERANARIADEGGRPLTMRTGHPDPETQHLAPVTDTAGRVTSLKVAADGSARFTAELYDSQAGRDVLALYDTRNQKPAVRNVSIRGRWMGDVTPMQVDGVPCEAGEDLELDGLDFTHLPGVDGAQVDKVAAPGAALEAAGAVGGLIYESCEEELVTQLDEAAAEADTKPYGDVPYADPGYQADKKKRYPLDTEKRAKAAWSYINQEDNAKLYTSAQLKRIKARIGKALKGFGVKVAKGGGVGEAWLVKESRIGADVAEHFGMYDDVPDGGDKRGAFSVNLDNGAVCINVSSYCIDPHDLSRIGTAAMQAATAALLVMDPDDDGDIDVPGAPNQDTDHGMEQGEAAGKAAPAADGEEDDEDGMEAAPPAADAPTETAAGAPAEEPIEATRGDAATKECEAPVMTDATQAAAAETAAPETQAAPATVTISTEALAEMVKAAATSAVAAVAEALKPAAPAAAPAETPAVETPAAPAQPAAVEAAPAAAPAQLESEDDRITRLVEAKLAERTAALEAQQNKFLQTAVAAGRVQPARKGLVGRVSEGGELQQVGEAAAEGLNAHGLPRSWAGDKAPHELTGASRAGLSAVLFEHYTNPHGNR